MNQIIGQDDSVSFLLNSSKQGKVGHAYLFYGPEGVGKALVAKFFAQLLNCEGKDDKPCYECNSCRKIEDKNHPDIFWIKPEEDSMGIKILAVREIQERISFKTYEAKYKIFIIEDADKLLEDAANCLLKTLEEPPAGSVLILIAKNREKIIPTIISRCQSVRFKSLNLTALENFLKDKFGIDKDKAEFLSRISEGSPGRASSFFMSGYLERRNLVLDELFGKKEFEDAIWMGKKMLIENMEIILSVLRDALFVKLGLGELIVNTDRKTLIEEFASRYPYENLHTIIRRLELYYGWVQHNANLRLILTSLEIDLKGYS
ncbi:MAG: DNA polymerase III subunit delta' [Candidatus Omnitrophica bacterium]|nr:DNA polymerase III subunit delta' [Candidatus Omnitrophota bacterium]